MSVDYTPASNFNGIETITYTVSDGTDSDPHDVTVIVIQLPSVNAGSDVSVCSGENVILTASGEGNFLWSTGETTSSISVIAQLTSQKK